MIPIGLTYFFFFAAFGLILPYLSPLLFDMGFSKPQIGWIQSGLAFISSIVPWLSGRLTDLFSTAGRTLQICGIGMFGCAVLMVVFQETSIGFIIALVGFAFFRAPVTSMQDTLALQIGDGQPKIYSLLRMMGSLGFAVTAILVSNWLYPGKYQTMLPFLAVLVLLFMVVNFFLPSKAKPQIEHRREFWGNLNTKWWGWLLAMSLHWLCFGPYHYGFTFLLNETSIEPIWQGWVWSLGVFTEILVLIFSGQIFARIHYRSALFLAMGANLVRWGWTGLMPTPWVVIFCQGLHGFGFALFYTAALQGIREYSRGQHAASFLGLFSSSVGGISSIVGLSLAGFLHSHMAFHLVLLWMVPIQIMAIFLLWRFPLEPCSTKG